MEPGAKLSVRVTAGEVRVTIADSYGMREAAFTTADWPKVRKHLEAKLGRAIQLVKGEWSC